jgi:hypothetical protein
MLYKTYICFILIIGISICNRDRVSNQDQDQDNSKGGDYDTNYFMPKKKFEKKMCV